MRRINVPPIGLSFYRVISLVLEATRILGALTFRPAPPEYTFRGLEPAFVSGIQHYQERCERKQREIENARDKSVEDGGSSPGEIERHYDEMEDFLGKYCTCFSVLFLYFGLG